MGTSRFPSLTASLLRSYSAAALSNADELLQEASLLLQHGHAGRAYFLAVVCIEEAGKALLAHDSQYRNLADPAVCAKLKNHLESHSQKINYALFMWALGSSDQRQAIKTALEIILQLQQGREPSIYCDLRTNPDGVRTPKEVVRIKVARDCVKLAENSLAYAHHHIKDKAPLEFSSVQDKLFTMKQGKYQKMLNDEDFWWYYLSCVEAGHSDIAEAILGYERAYIKADKLFRDS